MEKNLVEGGRDGKFGVNIRQHQQQRGGGGSACGGFMVGYRYKQMRINLLSEKREWEHTFSLCA